MPFLWRAAHAACLSAALLVGPAAAEVPSLRLAVAAPDARHVAWTSAARLADAARVRGIEITVARAGAQDAGAPEDLMVMPVRSLAARVPALQILEIPLLFSDLGAVHAALDAELGAALRRDAREAGWEVLAFWDEGMHALSGNRRFDRRRNLTAVEFLLLRPDPIAERAFHALDAWTRPVRPESREALLRECLVGSRAATLQQIRREELFRVHLDVTVAALRYEGWILAAPSARWRALPESVREAVVATAADTRAWQRREAARLEAQALATLRAEGMQVHTLEAVERQAFRERLPAAERMLPATLDPGSGAELVRLAGGGGGAALGGPGPQQGADPGPRADERQP